MKKTRNSIFETNSSSTHNMVVVEDSDLQKWKNGDLFYVEDGNRFVSKYEKEDILSSIYGKLLMSLSQDSSYKEEIIEAINNNKVKEYLAEKMSDGYWDSYDKPLSFDEWRNIWECRELAEDDEEFITKNGDKIHIFCQYGYEG